MVVDFTSPHNQWVALGDGFKVDARIVVHAKDNATKVPASALFRRGSEWVVYLAKNGRAQVRAVRIGHRSTSDVEVLDGLQPAERVVVCPSNAVSDGVRVTTK